MINIAPYKKLIMMNCLLRQKPRYFTLTDLLKGQLYWAIAEIRTEDQKLYMLYGGNE